MELRRVAPVVGLAMLLAADAVLIGWAFRPTPADGYVSAATSATAGSTGSGTASPKPTSSTKAVTVKPAPLEQFIAAVGPRIAWVVRSGGCPDPGKVWVTDDAGSSWAAESLPGKVMRVRPGSGETASGVGGDQDCELEQWTTADAGATWDAGDPPSGTWSRMPVDAAEIHTASDQLVRPCGNRAVIDLAPIDAKRAQVLCLNGDWLATTDGGSRWERVKKVKGALALTMADAGTGVLVTADSGCAGVVAVPVEGGLPAGEGECVKAPTQDGQVAVSNAGETWWLLVKDRVFLADDPTGPWLPTRRDLSG